MGLIIHRRQRDRLEGKEREGGFTLIELLIVIVVIGILAGIAIFAFNPFQQSAEAACDRANERIAAGVDAATAASEELGLNLTQDDFVEGTYADLTDCEFVAGPGGPGDVTITQGAFVPSEGTSNNPSITFTATEGSTLVAYSAHRSDAGFDGGGSAGTSSATMAGWSQVGFITDGTGTSDRRAIAVFTKAADGGSETAEVQWTNAGTAQTLTVREFIRDDGGGALSAGSFNAVDDDGSTGSIDFGGVSPGNGIVVAGLVARDDGGDGGASWSGVGGVESETPGNLHVSSGFTSNAGDVSVGHDADESSGFTFVLTP